MPSGMEALELKTSQVRVPEGENVPFFHFVPLGDIMNKSQSIEGLRA